MKKNGSWKGSFSTFQLFDFSTGAALALATLCAASANASHIRETMTLKKGWNAIYLESTPTNALCEEFFAGAPVLRVASYQSDAYSSTRQLADDGTEIAQKPVSYRVWVPGDDTASTMAALAGGYTYLVYATDTWSKQFYGVPSAPRQTWRATSGDTGFMNIVGVSADPGVSVPAKSYFGEGPFGTASGVAYQISGSKSAAPTFLSLGISSSTKLQGGKAYALTAARDGDWPGVIGVMGSGVFFGDADNFTAIQIKNCGTANHTFKFSVVLSDDANESGEVVPPLSRRLPRVDAISSPGYTNATEEAWTVELAPDGITEQVFSIDRAQMTAGTEYGAILVIEDLGASKMRVRLPVAVAAEPENAVAYPIGLWMGEIALSKVSGMTDETPTPVEAGGTLRMNVMVHVAEDGTCSLLQRVAAGMDADGNPRLFRELSGVPSEIENPRRISTVMMSVDTPVVAAADGSAFGNDAVFSWAVAPTARDNPFRHAWHPDHDGKTADYSGAAPSGDDFENYAQPIKPELWSITNRLEFSWHEHGESGLPVRFPYNADETTSGVVTWDVEGLSAKGPIRSTGTFTLKRVFKAKALE